MVALTFPDGARREYPQNTTGFEIAKGISPSLAKRTVAMALDGKVSDLSDPIGHDAKIEFLTRDDPRVTRVGRFIRKTSIDELPQLVNVLRGELSLVGPRPHAVEAPTANRLWEDVVDGYFARHRVKPGLTGWAQINGWRGELDTPEKLQSRVEHDLYYIENWSLMFDLYILLRTPFALMKTENAY